MDRTRRMHSGFALHIVDLDRFKEVNDTLAIRQGCRDPRGGPPPIQDTVRAPDIVARLGGDECASFQGTPKRAEAGALAVRLRGDQPANPNRAAPRSPSVLESASCWRRKRTMTSTVLISLADSALYQAEG